MQENLDEIRTQIRDLQVKQDKLLAQQLEAKREELESLLWLQDCKLYFKSQFGVYGNTEYVIWGAPIPEGLGAGWPSNRSNITLKGDSVHYYDNVVLRGCSTYGDMGVFEITSCNPKLFAEFIEENDIHVEPDATFREHVRVLNTVRDRMQ